MPRWPFPSARKSVVTWIRLAWIRTTASSTSMAFIFLIVLLPLLEILLSVMSRQSMTDALQLVNRITYSGNLPDALMVLVPGGPMLSCLDFPPFGESFEDYCLAIWSEDLESANPEVFQALDTTVAATQASTVFYNVLAELETAVHPLKTPVADIVNAKGKKKKKKPQKHRKPKQKKPPSPKKGGDKGGGKGEMMTMNQPVPSETYSSFTVPTGIITFPVGFLPPATSDFPTPTPTAQPHKATMDIIATIKLPDPSKEKGGQEDFADGGGQRAMQGEQPAVTPAPKPKNSKNGGKGGGKNNTKNKGKNKNKNHKANPKNKPTSTKPSLILATPPITPISLAARRSQIQKRDESISFHGRTLTIDAEFEPTNSSEREGRLMSVLITGLYPAPQGSSDVILIYEECVRSLVWVEQTMCNVLKENAAGIALWAWVATMGFFAVWTESTSMIITTSVGFVLATIFYALELFSNSFFQHEFQRAVVDGACGGVNVLQAYPTKQTKMLIAGLVIAATGLLLVSILGWNLLQANATPIWKRLDLVPEMKRPYLVMIALNVLFEISSFIMLLTVVLWLELLFSYIPGSFSDDQELEQALFSTFNGFVLPWLMLGWVAAKLSLCRTLIVFLVVTVPLTGGWIAIFLVDTYRVTLFTWQFFAILPMMSTLLTLALLVVGTIYRLDFKRALPQFLDARQSLVDPVEKAPDPERATPSQAPTYPLPTTQPSAALPASPAPVAAHTVHFDLPEDDPERSPSVNEAPSPSRPNQWFQDLWTPKRLRSPRTSDDVTDRISPRNQELWTPRRLRTSSTDNASRWTPARLRGISSSLFGIAKRTSRASSLNDVKTIPDSFASIGPPPSTLLGSIREAPNSPHYTDSSADLSEGGTWRIPRKGGVGTGKLQPPLEDRISIFSDETTRALEASGSRPAAEKVAFPEVPKPAANLKTAGRFAFGLK